MRPGYVEGASYAFQKFAVDAAQAAHVAELAGLGLLTLPAINTLAGDPKNDSPLKKKILAGTELAGLGTLALPTLHHLTHA